MLLWSWVRSNIPLSNTIVLTDIIPDERLRRTLLRALSPEQGNDLLPAVLEILSPDNAVEIASILVDFSILRDADTYLSRIEDILRTSRSNTGEQLFFYYSGHCVVDLGSSWQGQSRQVEDYHLVIPSFSQATYLSQRRIQEAFDRSTFEHSVILFDCCHASALLDLPIKVTFEDGLLHQGSMDDRSDRDNKRWLFLGSCSNDEKCSFFQGRGSIFTTLLVDTYGSCKCRSLNRLATLQRDITKYRKLQGRPTQTITLTSTYVCWNLPSWFLGVLNVNDS